MSRANEHCNHSTRHGQADSSTAFIRNQESRRARTHRRLVTILIVLLLLCMLAGIAAFQLFRDIKQIKDHEEHTLSLIDSFRDDGVLKRTDTMNQTIAEAQSESSQAKKIVHGPLISTIAHLPVYGNDVKAVQGMVDAVDSISQETLPQLSSITQQLSTASLSTQDSQINLKPISQASAQLNKTKTDIQNRLQTLKSLPQPKIGFVNATYQESVEKLTKVSNKINELNNGIQILPKFMGESGERTYIIVAQTTSESRSGGGLIGSMGSMNAVNGEITVNSFHPNSEFVPLGGGAEADAESIFSGPLKMGFDIRDLTAYQDFSQTAQTVNTRWQQSPYAGPVDGVIMIDPVFVQEMLKIGGQVRLPSGTVLNGDNAAEYFSNTIYKEVPIHQQDAVFASASRAALNDVLTNLDMDKLMKLANLIAPLAKDRHLYLYTFHEDEAANFQGAGLAKNAPENEERPEVGIYLNENNPSKLDWYIHRKTTIIRASCSSRGAQTYHVSFSMINKISQKDLNEAGWYILGGTQPFTQSGTALERILIYAPAGGSISNIKGGEFQQATLNGKPLMTGVSSIPPNGIVTLDFDVTTSDKATSDLMLDQTPMGRTDPGITNSAGSCPVQNG